MVLSPKRGDILEYTEKVEYKYGFKVVHRTPILTPEERDRREKEAIRKIYHLFCESSPDKLLDK